MAESKRLASLEKALRASFVRHRAQVFSSLPREVALRAADIGHLILGYETLPRAMDLLRQGLQGKIPSLAVGNGTVVLALELTRARGRFTRCWVAQRGGLWFSLALYDDWLPELRGWVPLLFGLGVTEALQVLGAPVNLKWINDVHYGGKKVCGVLMEQVYGEDGPWALVGLGLNVNNTLPEGLPAIGLQGILGRCLDLEEVFGLVLACIAKYYGLLRHYETELLEHRYQEEQPENPLYRAFLRLSDTLGRTVYWGYNLEEERSWAVVKDLTPKGELLLVNDKGEWVLSSGEILYLEP